MGQGKLSTPKQNFKKAKKNQTSTCNLGKPKKKLCKESSSEGQEEAPHCCAIQSLKEHFQRGPKVSQSQQVSAQHLYMGKPKRKQCKESS
jgi:hypothetical protein